MSISDPVATVLSGNPFVDGLLWGQQWSDGGPKGAALSVHLAGMSGPESFVFEGSSVISDMTAEVVSGYNAVLASIAAVCGLTFSEAAGLQDADLVLAAVDLPHQAIQGTSAPFTGGQSTAIINQDDYAADVAGLFPGGLWYGIMMHEIGHALGLKHPFDTGPGTTAPLFPGVTGAQSLGDFGLNQGIYTMMTYNDGYRTGPDGQTPSLNYGYQATPMAFDVATLQYLYGVNTTYRTGNDTYTLPSVDGSGTSYVCIWDAGGIDAIKAGGNIACTIDLHAATLRNEAGGGGMVSSHAGVHGGFTIAKGAVIENAFGGGAGDTLIGNSVSNRLRGFEGSDTLKGIAGADRLDGGAGDDTLTGGKGADTLDGGINLDTASYDDAKSDIIASLSSGVGTGGDAAGDVFISIENLTGSTFSDQLEGDERANRLSGADGADILMGGVGKDELWGGAANDTLSGGFGDDRLQGGSGADTLTGGGGSDLFIIGASADSNAAGPDLIMDFKRGQDRIDVSAIDANIFSPGVDNPFVFIGPVLAKSIPGSIAVAQDIDAGITIVSGDVNGDEIAEFVIHLNGIYSLTLADFIA